ncbi:hypothetical protein RHSIM_Rhsim01G0174000 [Rhododendron simsii]|uniref:DUF4283 domain-containing protein n=1 Tax=Rhododendron simsii TaxID=118357 RepID=A0A834HCM6_RHOSS|nr:hypothetical protein RHSIM_Rhsim01G0174000 [Rhododendron simsii]
MKRFSLTPDEKDDIVIDTAMQAKAIEACSASLVGKLLTKRGFGRAALKDTMRKVWGSPSGLRILDVGENLFLFRFSSEVDMQWVMNRGPWCFDNMLLLKQWEVGMKADSVEFTELDCWVQLRGLPFECITPEIGRTIGNRIGVVLDVIKASKMDKVCQAKGRGMLEGYVKENAYEPWLIAAQSYRRGFRWKEKEAGSFNRSLASAMVAMAKSGDISGSEARRFGLTAAEKGRNQMEIGGRDSQLVEIANNLVVSINGNQFMMEDLVPNFSRTLNFQKTGGDVIGQSKVVGLELLEGNVSMTDQEANGSQSLMGCNVGQKIDAVGQGIINGESSTKDSGPSNGNELDLSLGSNLVEVQVFKAIETVNTKVKTTERVLSRIPMGKGGSGRKQLAVNKRKGGGVGTVRIEERNGELLPWSGKRRLEVVDAETSQDKKERKGMWEELLGIAHEESSDWLVGGDLNAILHQDEKSGGHQRIRHLNAVVKHLAPDGSDHCPILLDNVGQWQVHGSRWFQIHEKIKACRMSFLHWRKQRPLNSRHSKEVLGSKLQHLFKCPNFNREEYSLTETLFKRALKNEEIYWKDKAQSNWLKAGDRKTTFFHAQTIQRRQQNRLVGLEDRNGCWREGNQAMSEIARDYFKNNFLSDGILMWRQF